MYGTPWFAIDQAQRPNEKQHSLTMARRHFLNWLLAFVAAAIFLCLPSGVSSSEKLATKVAFSRRIGKVNTYVELRCTATAEKPTCDVPDTVKIIQTGSPSRVSAKVVSIPDSLSLQRQKIMQMLLHLSKGLLSASLWKTNRYLM